MLVQGERHSNIKDQDDSQSPKKGSLLEIKEEGIVDKDASDQKALKDDTELQSYLKRSSSTSKKSSIILHRVEMNANNNNNNEIPSEQDKNQILGKAQNQLDAQRIPQHELQKKSIESDGNYTTVVIQCSQPESPTIKIKTLKDKKTTIDKIEPEQTKIVNERINRDIILDEQVNKKELSQQIQGQVQQNSKIAQENVQREEKFLTEQQKYEQDLIKMLTGGESPNINKESPVNQKGVDSMKKETNAQAEEYLSQEAQKGKFIKIKEFIASQDSSSDLKQDNRDQLNQLLIQNQRTKLQQQLNLQDSLKLQKQINTFSDQIESYDASSPKKSFNRYQNLQKDNHSMQSPFSQSPYMDYQTPKQQKQNQEVYSKILSESDTRMPANPKSMTGFESPTKSMNLSNQQKMSDMKSKVQSFLYDPKIKSFIENENENFSNSKKKTQPSYPSLLQLNSLGSGKTYVVSKLMIYWFEEEPFDDFYYQIKDMMIGSNVIPLQELAYKYSQNKKTNKEDNVWQINVNLEFNQDDILNSNKGINTSQASLLKSSDTLNSTANNKQKQLNEQCWRIAVRNDRGIDIVNGDLKIGETLLSCTEYGREQFVLMTSPYASLNQSLYAILHLVIDIQADIKHENLPDIAKVESQQKQQQLEQKPKDYIYRTSFFKHLSQIVRNEEKFFYYLIPNKYQLFPKRYIWLSFINDPEVNEIIQYYHLQQSESDNLQIVEKCKKKLEDIEERRILKILEWQGRMQAELLMSLVRKNVFDTSLLKSDKKIVQQHMLQRGIPQEYRLYVYSSIIDLYSILVNAKQQLEDIFQTSCTNVVTFLKAEAMNFCNPLIVSLSSFIHKKFSSHEFNKCHQLYQLYASYLLYDQITNDKQLPVLHTPSINLLTNICEHFLEEEQSAFTSNMQLSSKIPKFQSMKVSIPLTSSTNPQFKLAYQQFEQQQFFVFASLMDQLKEVDFNFIFQSVIQRLTAIYPTIDFNLHISTLSDLIYEGSYSYYANVLIGELWNRIIDCVFIELIDVQKLEVNFFLFCVSMTIVSIFLDYREQECQDRNKLFTLGDSLDEQIQEFFGTYLNFKQFFDVFYAMIKSEIVTYQQITASYADYMTKIKVINGNSFYRQNIYATGYSNNQSYSPDDLKMQLDQELMKLSLSENQNQKQNRNSTEVEMFIFMEDISQQILQKSVLTIKYDGLKQQKFVPIICTQKGNKIQSIFKTVIPFLEANNPYLEGEQKETILFELVTQISYSSICFSGKLEWDPVQLLYNKQIVYLYQKNNTSSTIDNDKTLFISIYLEPLPIQFQQSQQQQMLNQRQSVSSLGQNRVKQDSQILHQPPVLINEGTSLLVHKYDLQNQMIHQISTTIDPLRYPQESSPHQTIGPRSSYNLKLFSKEAVNDWFAKISYLISHNTQHSLDEKLKLLYLTLKSAFGYEVSIKNVLILFKEIARIQGIIVDFESLLLRASQIIGQKLKNSIVVSVNFLNGNNLSSNYSQTYMQKNQLIEVNSSIIEQEYQEVINQSFIEGVHIVDIRAIIGQVHKNLLVKSGITSISEINLINKYYLTVNIEGCTNNFYIDENGMIILTKKIQEQSILISKIAIFKNIFVDQSTFLGLITSCPFVLDYFCRYPELVFFTRQIPLILTVSFYDIENKKFEKTDLLKDFSLIEPISYIIEKVIEQGNFTKNLSINKIKCFCDRQQLYLNDNLINQIDVKSQKMQSSNELLIALDIYETDEILIKLPHSEIAKSRMQYSSQINYTTNIVAGTGTEQSEIQPIKSSQQLQAIIFSSTGIRFESISKLPMNDIFQMRNQHVHISENNLYII